ncbi:MAG: hypothetical protein AB2827_00290 [Candidatus Thiodiazotropha sp.]
MKLDEFIANLPRNPGLVFGEKATVNVPNSDIERVLNKVTPRIVPIHEAATLLDELSDTAPSMREQVEEVWKDFLRKLTKPLDLPYLATAGWSACVSATKDLLFESELITYLESIPASKTVTIVDSPTIRVPPRSIPIFKLYGSLNVSDTDRKLVLSTSDTLIRREMWSQLLKQLPDQLKGAPMVFIGVPVNVVTMVLTSLHAQPHPRVREIYYLAGDETFNDPTVKSLCTTFDAKSIDATYRDLCNAVAELKEHGRTRIARPELSNLESTYSTIVSILPTGEAELDFESHRNALIDSLFRPKSVDWIPYQLHLDLERTVSDEIYQSIILGLEHIQQYPKTVNIRGEAAVGKTAVAKNVAAKVARKGVFVAWVRTAPYNWRSIYREMFKDLKSHEEIKSAVFFCDDPHSLKLDPNEIISGLEDVGVPAVLVIVNRSSDYFSSDHLEQGGFDSDSIEVPIELDDQEIAKLPLFLKTLGIVETAQQGGQLVRSIGTPTASDVLCSLWYLVPYTKSQIAESLRDQYMRLGDSKAVIHSVAETAASSSDIAKRAYEFVTVSSSLNIGLPVEVLVRALQVDYPDWIDMCVNGRPLWGLIYDEVSDDGDTIEYWTRNEIVTQILLDLVNGGVGNAGQVRTIGKLIEVCSDGSPIYRDFVMNILVRSRRSLESNLTFQQGMELYTLAEDVLGTNDKTLEFHKGIWMQHKGQDLAGAYTQLKRTLNLPELSESTQYAPNEHIHTSMAATVLDMIQTGGLDLNKGVAQIRDHLKHATSPTFFNPHSSHVTARMLFKIARSSALTGAEDLRAECFAEALREIEKALQLIGSAGRSRFRDTSSIEYLRSLQRDILDKMPTEDELRELANQMFTSTRCQAGYAALARRIVAFASERNKGTDYNAAYQEIEGIVSKLLEAEQNIDLNIIATRVDLIVRWRIQRTGGPVDWKAFNTDLELLLSSTAYRDSIVTNFLSAVSCFHLEDTARSTAKFSNLRRLNIGRHTQRAIRAYYLNKEGQPRRVQFTLVRRSGRYYLESSHLGIDIPINETPRSLRPGDTTHAYIGFSLLGQTAVFDRPTNTNMLLP